MSMHSYLRWKKFAMTMAANVFWLPPGISATDVLAAYRFKGVGTKENALSDLGNNHWNLTEITATWNEDGASTTYPKWDTTTGYYLKAGNNGQSRAYSSLNNNDLNNADIQSAVVCYTSLKMDWPSAPGGSYPYDPSQVDFGALVTAGGASGVAQLYGATTYYRYTETEEYIHYGQWSSNHGPGYLKGWTSDLGYSYGRWEYVENFDTNTHTAGVVGANFGGTSTGLYVNGTRATGTTGYGQVSNGIRGWCSLEGNGADSSKQHGYTFGCTHVSKNVDSGLKSSGCTASKKLIAAAFFKVPLTADQHKFVADAMLAL